MTNYAGIDLHSSNCYLAVIDQQQRQLCGAGCCLCVSAPCIFSACRAWWPAVAAAAYRSIRSSSSHQPMPRLCFQISNWALPPAVMWRPSAF